MRDDQTAADLRARGGLKWTNFEEDVLGAWVAEMDFGLAPPVAQALHEAVDRGDTGYIYPDAMRRVAEAGSAFWNDRLGWAVSPDRVFAAPDVVDGIRRAIVHLTRPGSPVILHTPAYYPFFSMVERAGRDLIQVPSRRTSEGGYTIDSDGLDQAFSQRAGSLVLCNPWNPTGRCLTEAEVAKVVAVSAAHGARVISDEIHAPLIFTGSAQVVAASLDPDTVVTVTSASKAWNLPGLKCAQVVLTNDDDVAKWASYFTFEKVAAVGTFGLIAGAVAYSEGRPWLDEVVARLESNRRLLGDLIDSYLPNVGYTPPEATYLAWLDFRPYGLDDPAAFLLEHARVALTGGGPFGLGGEGFARLNFATPAPILTQVVERIGAVL